MGTPLPRGVATGGAVAVGMLGWLPWGCQCSCYGGAGMVAMGWLPWRWGGCHGDANTAMRTLGCCHGDSGMVAMGMSVQLLWGCWDGCHGMVAMGWLPWRWGGCHGDGAVAMVIPLQSL